jgi:hypothetical protein
MVTRTAESMIFEETENIDTVPQPKDCWKILEIVKQLKQAINLSANLVKFKDEPTSYESVT